MNPFYYNIYIYTISFNVTNNQVNSGMKCSLHQIMMFNFRIDIYFYSYLK